jgi:hypothetical protein
VSRTQADGPGGYASFLIPAVKASAVSTAPAARSVAPTKARFDVVTLLTAYLLLLFFIPSTLVFGPLGGAGTPAMVAALCILLWYIASWIVGRVTPSRGGRPVRVAMFVFSLAVLASFVAAMTRNITQMEVLSADRALIILTAWVGLVVVMSESITSYERLDTLLRRAVVAGSVVGAIGIFQYYSGVDITKYFQIPGLVPRVDITTLLSRNGLNRPSSTATQPIEFGVVMAMLLPFALQQAMAAERPGKMNSKFRRWAPVLLIAFAVMASVSRSGIIGVAVAMLFLLPTWNRQRRLTALVAVVLGAMAMKAAAPGLIHTLITYFSQLSGNSNPYATAQARTNDYAYVFHYVAQRPWFGMGFGTFVPGLYIFTDNMYLNGFAEIGYLGVAALLVLYFAGLHCAAAGRRRTRDERRREIGQAMVASIAVGIVASATFDSLSFPMFSGLFFLIMGASGAYLGITTAESRLLADEPGYPGGSRSPAYGSVSSG